MREPRPINQTQSYRSQCLKCHAVDLLERTEPSVEPDRDVRTFECVNCGHSVVVKMRRR